MPETIRLLTADGEFVAEIPYRLRSAFAYWNGRIFQRTSTNDGDEREYREVKK